MSDLFDELFDNHHDDDEDDDRSQTTRCRHCGATNVYWEQNWQKGGAYELREFSLRGTAGKRHRCGENPERHERNADFFEDLD
jgi:hypothetical protein